MSEEEENDTIGVAFGVAETVANSEKGFESSDWLLDEIAIDSGRRWWKPWTWFRTRPTSFSAKLTKGQ